MKEKAILVVIPHYGSDELLARLLPTLGVLVPSQDMLALRQIVVPFAYGEVCIVNNNISNAGFTKACNEGVAYGLSRGFEAIWLLNNDTQIKDLASAITAFWDEFESNPKTGVIGCQMLSLADPDFIHHGGTTAAMPRGIHKTGYVSQGDFQVRSLERWVTGASMVISRDCLQKTGLLDDNLFNYASDSDYCYRSRAAGYDVVYLPVPILHEIGQSANPSPAQHEILRNDVGYFMSKWVTGALFERLNSGVL